MSSLEFDFHGIVGLRIDAEDQWTREYFEHEFGFAAGPMPSGHPDVELKFHYSAVPVPPGDGFRLQIHKAFARWFYRLCLNQPRILIEAVGNHASVPMVHHMLVHPSLRYLSSRKGVLLLHGAAVCRSGRSLIITGSGGAGKTTTSAILLDSDDDQWAIQGDDYTFVVPGGQTLAYPTRAHLYRSILEFLPELADRIKPRERLHLEAFGLIRRVSGERIKWPLRMDLERLWASRPIERSADLAGILLLRRKPEAERLVEPCTDRAGMVQALLQMNFHEARHFLQLVRRTMDGTQFEHWHAEWRQVEQDLLEQLVATSSLYWLNLPRRAKEGHNLGPRIAEELTALVAPPNGQ